MKCIEYVELLVQQVVIGDFLNVFSNVLEVVFVIQGMLEIAHRHVFFQKTVLPKW